ncbi:fumarylacetoacetate hydrolase family protein [Neomegalonema sp.]|uniref:fumarylacetoacetate hydrolase family protein n=1 Tax=Neomegalonema sp. TaxID=2039713 RepID=UPI002619EE3D|nr:fumarylacetoacetate hydrolase family protein [Neomegalonema sp.]MDD2868336.1 fumarylacetoacetate hydrolase family protein [Neomegalonema sp.]
MAEAFVIPPPPTASLAVEGETARFPVGRIFCIGRNYADHAREMGHDPDREPPFFFMKPVSALATDGIFRLPRGAQEVHHEVELMVALKSGGAEIAPEEALTHVFGYGVGLDMTRRDLQAAAKKLGRPWETAKGFDGSAPCGALVPADRIGHPAKGAISLAVDGEIRQKGDLGDMIWGAPDLIAAISRAMALRPGDLILTGTPAGVGAVRPGDRLEARIEGLEALVVEVRG